jgi:hypothetical protein
VAGPDAGTAGRCCRACGRDYPGDLDRCPQCGGQTAVRLAPTPEFWRLRVLAKVLSVLLAFVTAATAARVVMRELGPYVGTASRGYVVMQLDKITDVTIFGLSIVFVVWFHRARINAEQRGWPQRWARGWTFWGWIVPVVSLWFPFQLMGDIWRAGLPASRRGKAAWLPALWWASFLVSDLTSGSREEGNRYFMPHLSGDTPTVSMCLLGISGVLLIAIVHVVSNGPVGWPHTAPPMTPPGATCALTITGN